MTVAHAPEFLAFTADPTPPLADNEIVDVVVIGAGPVGLACAMAAVRSGLTVRVIDKGCVVNTIFGYPINTTFFSTADRLEIGGVPFPSAAPKPTRREAMIYYRRAAVAYGLDIRQYELLIDVTGSDGDFTVETTKGQHKARKVVLATGYYDQPRRVNIPGEDLPQVSHYFSEGHPYSNLDVTVLGGKNSAVEAALELYRDGARVTMVMPELAFARTIKYWLLPDIENRIKSGEVKAYFGSKASRITPGAITVESPDGPVEVKADFVFALTGYEPNYPLIRKLGVTIDELSDGPLPRHNPATFESDRPGLYLAGVVAAGCRADSVFIEVAREHAHVIGRALAAALKPN